MTGFHNASPVKSNGALSSTILEDVRSQIATVFTHTILPKGLRLQIFF